MAVAETLVSVLTLVGIYAILAMGLNVKFGYAGILDIGHVVFYLIGAYTTALLVAQPAETQEYATYVLGLNMPWLPAILLGTLTAGIFGMLVSLPAIRLREDYIAIVMLGFSIIGIRLVQSENWLANGPDSLSAYSVPLASYFPLPTASLGGTLLLGIIVGTLWAGATYALARWEEFTETARTAQKLRHGLFALTTLGIGYGAARYLQRQDRTRATVLAVTGVGVGGLASVCAMGGEVFHTYVLFISIGSMSLFTWIFGLAQVESYLSDLSWTDLLVGSALAVGFVGALLPGVLVGGQSDTAIGVIGLVGMVVLLGGYVYGVYKLAQNSTSTADFGKVIALATLVLFLIRYFIIPLTTPLLQGDVMGVVYTLLQNLLWLVEFSAGGVEFDYSRFLLLLTFISLSLTYIVLELIVNSPFGRVLTAVGEDEQVTSSLGKNTFSYKIQSMMLGSAIAGFAGGLTAIYFQSLTYNMFHPRVTFFIFLILIIGGTGSNKGMLFGAALYWGFQKATVDIAGFFPSGELRTQIQGFRLAIFGLLFVLIIAYRPDGLIGQQQTTKEAVDE